MIGEAIIIGLQLAILAGLAGDKKPKREEPTDKKEPQNRVTISDKKQARISNSGERFVQCPLNGYQSFYQIGDLGTIRKVNGRVPKIYKTADGKEHVNLTTPTKNTTFSVERLVALAFLIRPAKGNLLRKKIVHINGDIHDNRAVNLMWR